ncbi:MAG: trigger factor [Myxococcota bacterium]
MDIQVEKTGPAQAKLSVKVAAAAVDEAFEKVFREIAKTARLPGFRPGKIPRGVLEKHYGDRALAEVQERLVDDSLGKAMDEAKLTPVAILHVHPEKLARGAGFGYTAELEVHPEVTLKKIDGLDVPHVEVVVAESDIEEQLETMRKQAAQLVPVLLRDSVQDGDVVVIDYEGTVDGAPLEGGKAAGALVEIGATGYIPGFAEALTGAKVPSERSFPVTFPADYGAEHLRGKTAKFHAHIKELKTKELPALDDAFAADVGEESLDALRAKVRERILTRKQREAEGEQRGALLKALVAENPVDLPPTLVRSQAARLVQGARAQVEQMVGQRVQLSQDELADLEKDSHESAEFQVRAGMLLAEVAKQAGLDVEDAEINIEIDKIAGSMGEQARQLREYLNRADERGRIRYRLLEDKAVAHLLARASKSEAKASV